MTPKHNPPPPKDTDPKAPPLTDLELRRLQIEAEELAKEVKRAVEKEDRRKGAGGGP